MDATGAYATTCRSALAAEQASSLSKPGGWSHVDKQQVHADWDRLYRTLAALTIDAEASSPQIQELMAQHYAIACRFYVPSKGAYIGMSLFYAENVEMRNFHDQYGANLVTCLAAAVQVFAHGNL